MALLHRAMSDRPATDEFDVLPPLALAAGGAAGWAIGSTMTRWETIYPPPPIPLPREITPREKDSRRIHEEN
jgi:hypothetical protein